MFSGQKFIYLGLLLGIGAGMALAQEASEGIPIDNQLTIQKCGGCHVRDNNGMMRRLSQIRTSPEVWEQAIKRMIRLNGLSIKPEEARDILKYLSANNGLAPEESKPVFWEAEHRMQRDQSDKVPADAIQHTCNYCHTIGRVLTQRRTKADYDLLVAMHVGMFPGAENQFRPRRTTVSQVQPARTGAIGSGNPFIEVPNPTGVTPANAPYPVDTAVAWLAKNQPLITPEWAAWKSAMKTPKLEGKWMLTGYQTGKGRVFGTLTVEAGSAPDEFNTKLDLEYAASGQTFSRTGKGIIYTGYTWRGRSTTTKAETDPNGIPAEWREALFLSRDGNSLEGRWYWGGYQEFGIDAKLVRIGTGPVVGGVNLTMIKSPSSAAEVKVYGANLPANPKASDFDFGTGITVKRVVKSSPTMATVEVDVAAKLPSGARDVVLAHATAEKAITVYDKVAYIKVTPDANMARLGGTMTAKQFAQFEAVGFAAGPDGKPNTADDVPLGAVKVKWGMEEFGSTGDDDDIKFVGNMNPDTGMFTPNIEGPNPERKKQSNNYATNNWGDVWITAGFDNGGQMLKARSYLVVTIPTYVRYDQPEVGQ